jgi:hypothetical protein
MIQRKITLYAFVGLLICSVLLPNIAPFFVLILCFVWFWEGDFKNKVIIVTRHKFFWIIPVYFSLLLLSMLFVDELKSSMNQIEVLSIFVALPLLLPTLKSLNFTYYKPTFKRVLVGTILVAFAICLFRAGYFTVQDYFHAQGNMNSRFESGISYFLGSSFCGFLMPPGHLALYINLAIFFQIFDLKKTSSRRKIYLRTLTVLLMLVFVALLNSKIGFVLLGLVVTFIVVRTLMMARKKAKF